MEDAPRDLASALASGVDVVGILNAHRGGFERQIGFTFTAVTPDALEGELTVSDALTQPYGLVHGGVYATVVETLASAAAALDAYGRGQSTVGLENSTSFLHGVRSGRLHARATPVHRGRTTQVWQVEIRAESGKLAATGRVRMLCMDSGAAIAGEKIAIKSDQETRG